MACGVVGSPCRIIDTLTDSHCVVFSKCAESMENGRRLENLSWRIWNRETLCCENQPQMATTPAIQVANSRPKKSDVPDLSASVDSIASENSDTVEESDLPPTTSLCVDSSPTTSPSSTIATSRGREKHITSLGLEKMICSVKYKTEITPLSPTISNAIPTITPSPPKLNASHRSSNSSTSTASTSSPDSDRSATQTVGSDTSAELNTSHSIVRGFSPNKISSSYRSNTHLAPTPTPAKSMLPSKIEEPKKSGGFFLSGSSGEDDSSFEDRMSTQLQQSSLTTGLKRPPHSKKTSFRDEVESRKIANKLHEDEGVFDDSSDEEDDDIPDSAIDSEEDDEDEDDEGDWEDDASESNDVTANGPMFPRVDSKPNLVSRRSLLTTLMSEGDRAAAFQNMASRSTPALRRSRTSKASESPEENSVVENSTAVLGPQMTRSKPIIMTTSNGHHQMALSPRTTRRNMLATEMTESLRKHVLWERQQKKATANAVLKRRHTAHNLVNLQQHPGQPNPHTANSSNANNASWDFGNHGLGAYHEVGW